MPTDVDDLLLVRADLPSVTLGGDVIVFDPEREQAHLLNYSAASVWLSFDTPRSIQAVTEHLAGRYGAEPAELEADVEAAARDLTQAGILTELIAEPATTGPETPDAAETSAVTEPPEPDGYSQQRNWAYVSPEHRCMAVTFRVETTDPALGSYLHRVLAPLREIGALPEPGQVAPPRSWTYRIWPTDDDPERFVVATGHTSLSFATTRADAASTVMWHFNRDTIEHTHHLLLFHSAAVANDGGVLALPAVANSGKSTLATLLVHSGYRYLTDEALAVDPETLLVHPYPKPIGLDPGSFPLFAHLEPTAVHQPPELFHEKWWLDPRTISPHGDAAVPTVPLPLRAVVFPIFDADADPAIEPVEPAEGVVLLARNTFNLKSWGQRGLDVLAEIATSVPLFRMTHNDLDATAEMLTDVIGPAPAPGTSGLVER